MSSAQPSNPEVPHLDVTGPGGESFRVDLPEAKTVTIGRTQENGVVLGRDPHVSRLHCSVEYRDAGLWVTDNGSTNGTLVFHRGEWRWVFSERMRIDNGEVIRISGRPRENPDGARSPGFWDLTFRDPMATQPVDVIPWVLRLELDWQRRKLFRVSGRHRQELPVSHGSQEYRLLQFMDERNAANHRLAADCTHDELILAVWEGDQSHNRTPNDIAHLVRELRRKIEAAPEKPRFLVTVRGGYRLETHPLPDYASL